MDNPPSTPSAPPPSRRGAGFLLTEKWPLVALCVSVATTEAILLRVFGATWAAGMAPQVVAPAPFGVFHDLRWLVVYHRSLPAFFVEFGLLLVFRSLLDTALVRLALPRRTSTSPLAPPLGATAGPLAPAAGPLAYGGSFLRAWGRTLVFTLIAAVLLAPWVVLLFGLAVVSLSWLFFSAIPPVVAVAVLTNGGPVSGDWWRRTVPLRAVGWMALTFVVMTVCGGLASAHPASYGVPVAALGGLFNAWAWRGVVGAATSERRSRRFRPVAPAGLAFLLAVVVGGSEIGFAVASARAAEARAREEQAAARFPRPDRGPGVLIAAGFGTRWDGTSGPWLPGPFDETRFSYRGLDPSGRPRPYGPTDTTVALQSLDDEMATQVDALAARHHGKVSIVAVSEGSLVTETYLARYPGAPVSRVVLLAPLVTPGRVYYPPSGVDGWGVVGGLGLQALSDALGGVSPLHLSPSTPLFRSIVTEAPAIRTLLSCPPPGIRQVAVEPVADAVAAPVDPDLGIPTVVVPAFHSGALGDPGSDRAVEDVLQGRPLPPRSAWTVFEHVIRPASAAWQVPVLALTVNPAWRLASGTVTNNDTGLTCASARGQLASTGGPGPTGRRGGPSPWAPPASDGAGN